MRHFYAVENLRHLFEKSIVRDQPLYFPDCDFPEPILKEVDMVVLGCSYTRGIGVREGKDWGSQLAEMLGISYCKIAAPGRSVSWIVDGFFEYVYKFGNPKVVVALFPDFARAEIKSKPEFMISNRIRKDIPEIPMITYPLVAIREEERLKKYFKSPVIAEEVYPIETGFDLAIQYIKILELYCRSNNIKLLWSLWEDVHSDWIEYNIDSTYFKDYISIENHKWHGRAIDSWHDIFCGNRPGDCKINNGTKCNNPIDCHSDQRSEYGEEFDLATDAKGDARHHWGIHRHVHVAEKFMENLNEYNTRN